MRPQSLFWIMSRSATSPVLRVQAVARHMMSTTSSAKQELRRDDPDAPVLFHSNLAVRQYVLNRPKKLNALDGEMIGMLSKKIREWNSSDLCDIIVGTGEGRAFCAGGDVATVARQASNPDERHKAADFFKKEFELDYLLASIQKPYVAIMNGITFGGGVGLCAPANFRIATEKTRFAMPETKIGYCPDVGASYYLSRLDGGLGTYLALTGDSLNGRAVYEHGFATHFVSSDRLPKLLEALSALEKPKDRKQADFLQDVNDVINEYTSERQPAEAPPPFTGELRSALDQAFRFDDVNKIWKELSSLAQSSNEIINKWARETIKTLSLRSPTSLAVSLRAIRDGKKMTLAEALNMELRIAYKYCIGASPDFITGVKAVLIDKTVKDGDRPQWKPSDITDVTPEIIEPFFSEAPGTDGQIKCPELEIQGLAEPISDPYQFSLPSEKAIEDIVTGSTAGKGSGNMGITFEELLDKFEDQYHGKLGIPDRIGEVAARKCDVVDNADGNFVWLRWRH